jgi:hypothetical protein
MTWRARVLVGVALASLVLVPAAARAAAYASIAVGSGGAGTITNTGDTYATGYVTATKGDPLTLRLTLSANTVNLTTKLNCGSNTWNGPVVTGTGAKVISITSGAEWASGDRTCRVIMNPWGGTVTWTAGTWEVGVAPTPTPTAAPTATPTPAPTEDTRPVALSAADRDVLGLGVFAQVVVGGLMVFLLGVLAVGAVVRRG